MNLEENTTNQSHNPSKDIVYYTCRIPTELHRKLKLFSITNTEGYKNQNQVIVEALSEWLSQKNI